MSNNKQSSINLFIEQLELIAHLYEETEGVNKINVSIDVNEYLALKQQAKAMHKEEIENAYREGWMENIRCKHTPNRYYNETFGGNND
jgi:hypothetical protein